MKKVKLIYEKNIYILTGQSSANSHLYENEEQLKLFLKHFDRYFKKYIKLIDYAVTQEGWMFIVKIKDKRTIRKYFHKDSNRKDKDTWELWRIIGERMRLFLSNVRQLLNGEQGRKGSNVRKSFEKYCFTSLKEAKQYIKLVRQGKINLGQPLEKYQPSNEFFDCDGKIAKSLKDHCSIMTSRDIRFNRENFSKGYQMLKLKILNLLNLSDQRMEKLIHQSIGAYIKMGS